MNKDQSLKVMSYIDPALLESADTSPAAGRMRKPVKIALIAACVCVLMVGSVFAASGIIGVNIREYFSGDGFAVAQQTIDPLYEISADDAHSGYVVERRGTGVSFDAVSENVKSMFEDGEGKQSLRFGSMAELEQYLGVNVYDNTALDALQKEAWIEYDSEIFENVDGYLVSAEAEKNYGAVLSCSGDTQGLSVIKTVSYWGLDNGALTITVTTEALREGADFSDTAYVYADGTVFSEEEYTTDDGAKVDIIRCGLVDAGDKGLYGPDPHIVSYAAHFYADGLHYCVEISTSADADMALQMMKNILDAFEFNN